MTTHYTDPGSLTAEQALDALAAVGPQISDEYRQKLAARVIEDILARVHHQRVKEG